MNNSNEKIVEDKGKILTYSIIYFYGIYKIVLLKFIKTIIDKNFINFCVIFLYI